MTVVRWAAPEWHESIGSTNTEALSDPRPGRVVVADHQSEGLGRRGRRWQSPPGRGMAISTVLPPVAPEHLGWLPLSAGVAAVRAVDGSRWPVPVALKWPNDVLAVHRPVGAGAADGTTGPLQPVLTTDDLRSWGKLAGILAQVADSGDVVVGTGINVDHEADELPVPTATSWRLARGGAPLPDGARPLFLEHYLHHLGRLHAHLAAGEVGPVRTAYLELCLTVGMPVVVHRPDGGRTIGRAVTVDRAGALVVQGRHGRSVHHAGDVEHVRPGGGAG